MTSMASVQEFLALHRFAIVGVSRKDTDFSRSLWREFRSRGYDVVPVNPEAKDIDGQHCFAHVADVEPPIEGALVMTPPAASEDIVRECASSGIRRIWLFRGGGKGSVSDGAVRFCETNGIAVIPGECPFMFLPHGGFVHRFHGFLKKITGSYPC